MFHRFLAFILTATAASSAFAETRTWKSADASRSIQGEFVKRDPASVTIRTPAGKEVPIALSDLHPDETKWLNDKHPIGGPAPDPAAVFDKLLFGDDRKTVEKKLKASEIVEMTSDSIFLGRSGLNGVFHTRRKIGKVRASLYFDWTENDKLKELTLQTELLPGSEYESELRPTWGAFIELLSMLYGTPSQQGSMPQMNTLRPGTFSPSHLWEINEGTRILLGAAREKDQYQLVVRFTRKKIDMVEIP